MSPSKPWCTLGDAKVLGDAECPEEVPSWKGEQGLAPVGSMVAVSQQTAA